jgi:hypothetical protein
MTFSEVVQQVIELSRAAQKVHDDWALEHNSNTEWMVCEDGSRALPVLVPLSAYIDDPPPDEARQALRAFLSSQPSDVIFALFVLIDVGWVSAKKVRLNWHSLRVRSLYAQPDRALQKLAGTRGLSFRLKAGLARLAKAGLAADALL